MQENRLLTQEIKRDGLIDNAQSLHQLVLASESTTFALALRSVRWQIFTFLISEVQNTNDDS